jgi:hypothetical protein
MQPALSIKQEQARRAAQSKRDKAASKKGNGTGGSAPPRAPNNARKEPNDRRVPSNLMPRGVRNNGRESFLGENVTFDELVADINGSSNFTASKFAVQPGLASTFPKGAIKAALYSEWKMVDCEFYFKPEVSQYAAQGQTGKVIVAMDYNAGNPAPTTKQQVEIMHVKDDMPYEIIRLRLDASCVNKADSKYIRTGPIPVDEDIKTFDGGNLWVCTIGQPGAGLVGELHVRYNFRCTKPTLLNPPQGGLLPLATASEFLLAAPQSFVNGTPANLGFDTVVVDGIKIGLPAAGVFTPPAGYYKVTLKALFKDTSAEGFVDSIVLFKNGAATVPEVQSTASGASIGNQLLADGLQWVGSVSGSDTLSFNVTLEGAAGTLTAPGGYCTVVFQAL